MPRRHLDQLNQLTRAGVQVSPLIKLPSCQKAARLRAGTQEPVGLGEFAECISTDGGCQLSRGMRGCFCNSDLGGYGSFKVCV